MPEFDELKITPGQSLDAIDWNGLVEKVENLKLEIAPNLSANTLTLGEKGWLLKAHNENAESESGDLSISYHKNETWNHALSIQKATGNVGIGTTNPLAKLHVNGSIRGDHKGGALKIETEFGFVTIGPVNDGWAHFATDRSKYYFNKEIRVDSGKIGSYIEDLELCIEGNTKLTIKKDGNVGIGTSNPLAKLHVNGSIRGNHTGGALKIETQFGYVNIGPVNDDWAHFYTDRHKYYFDKEIRVDSGKIGSYNQDLQLCVEGKSQLTIKKNGNVGIGTTSPGSTLHVDGQLTLEAGEKERGWIVIKSHANDAAAKELLDKLGHNQLIIGGCWENKIYFYWKDENGKHRRIMLLPHLTGFF